MSRFILVCAVLAMANASAAQFKFGTQTLTVPDGFEVERVAGPPLVNRPINMSLDEQGRLYVTDSAGMSEKAQKQLETKPHRIVRLDAANANGVFEKSVVFADKMMFPEGCLWHDGSLFVAAPPQIWKLTDTKGDGVADKREVWHDGKTLTGCANDLHGPYLGRDGWIYWCKGAFAEQTITLPDGKPFVSRASHIFRARPDGTGIEPVLTGGMDNPVGLAFNSVGERFLSCTFFQNPAGGKRDGLIHAIYGGVYGKVHDVLTGHKMTGGVMPVLTNWGAAAPCGMTCYDSKIFGAEFNDNLFTCCFNLHKVIRTVLVPDGATYTAQDSDFISSDSPDFHPTDVLEDADGSLLIADTGGWYKICCPTSQLAKPDVLGAIYRIRKTGAKVLDDPRGLKIEWSKSTPDELARFLDDDRVFVRHLAISAIRSANSEPVVKVLREVLEHSLSPEQRRNAAWALARIDLKSAHEAIDCAMSDKDVSVVHAAIHAGTVNHVESFRMVTREDNPALVRAAAEGIAHAGKPFDVRTVLMAIRNRTDPASGPREIVEDNATRVFEHSLIYALMQSKDESTLRSRLRAATNPYVARVALIALDQMDGESLKPEELQKHLESTCGFLRETAIWIAGHHSEWGDGILDYLKLKLTASAIDPVDQSLLIQLLSAFAKAPKIQELLAQTALSKNADARLIALRAMAGAGLKETPRAWVDALAKVIESSNGAELEQAIATVQMFKLPKGNQDLSLGMALYGVGNKPGISDGVFLNALAANASLGSGFQCDDSPNRFQFLLDNVALSKPAAHRNAACAVLVKTDITPGHIKALAGAMKDSVGPLEIRQLLPAFERGVTDQQGMILLDALKNSKYARGMRAEIVRPVFAKYSKAVQDAAAVWLAELSPNAAVQAAHLDELLKKLPPGDVARGHVVFHGMKTACTTCHATGYLGGTLGPDLTRVGQTRTERDLLEAIVYPSASFVRSYEPFAVRTTSGERFNGILKKDAPDEIILAIDAKTEKHIARADIAKLEPGTVSVMPEGFETLMTAQELADLIAFLRASK